MLSDLAVSSLDLPKRLTLLCFISGCIGICDYCYNRGLWKKVNGPLTIDDVLRKIEKENKKYRLITGLSITGAEPISRPNDIRFLSKEVKNRFDYIYINIDTSLTQCRIVPEILEYVDQISISIKDCWKRFPEVKHNLKLLFELNKTIEFRIVLTKTNVSDILKIIDEYQIFIENLNPYRVLISPAVEVPENQGMFLPLNPSEFLDSFEIYKEKFENMGVDNVKKVF